MVTWRFWQQRSRCCGSTCPSLFSSLRPQKLRVCVLVCLLRSDSLIHGTGCVFAVVTIPRWSHDTPIELSAKAAVEPFVILYLYHTQFTSASPTFKWIRGEKEAHNAMFTDAACPQDSGTLTIFEKNRWITVCIIISPGSNTVWQLGKQITEKKKQCQFESGKPLTWLQKKNPRWLENLEREKESQLITALGNIVNNSCLCVMTSNV